MMFYDVPAHELESYFQFVMSDMVPVLHEMGLYLFRAFQTIPGQTGDDPRLRQVEYVAEDLETILTILHSPQWSDLEARLQGYVNNYSRKIVRFRQGFQL